MGFSSQMARNIEFFKMGASGGVVDGRPDHPLKHDGSNPSIQLETQRFNPTQTCNGSTLSPVNMKNCHPGLSHLPPSTFLLATWLKPPARYVT
jgi:hypothetical protein